MVLKSLILQGFKSFPDKTEIHFLGGMTAIVGPNGSGKSNISDAIRWVLGEQSSRSLRGAKMEDVIFGGTAKRGPVGFAEVSLILDNSEGVFRSEFTEIMVTRRYYRSGESEYFLNKKHCRLRDIHELFMDTGLGRDGYSIIGQGRIDEILSLKSEDRREIFEEAAGITKFRYRKEEAERKLAATEDNLTRIRDLYDELERQVGPLEKQAEKAKQYLLLRDELRVLEISLWLLSLERIKTDTAKLEQDTAACSGQLRDAKQAQEALYAQSEQLSEDMRAIDREADRLRQQLRETEQRAAEQASRAAVLRANIQNHRENIDRARRESEQRSEQAHNLGAQLTERRARIALLDTRHTGLAAQLTDLEQQTATQDAGRTAAEQALRQAQQARDARQNELHALALDRTAAETSLASMDGRRDTIAADIDTAGKRLEQEKQAQDELETRMQACLDTLAGAKNKVQGIALKADSRRSKVETLQGELTRAQAALTDANNRVKMLRDMQRDYEGFSRSVKSIMQQVERGAMRGVHGPVSSLITTDDRFVTAIDTALGASASSIVVDTAQDGKRCIEFLRRTDGGRATFLPIDTIRPNSLRETGLEGKNGCFGTADRLVTFDKRYTAIVQNLLARTVVSENMDTALALARAYGHRFRIVTLDGQIIQAGGAMTGGSASRGTGALARAGRLKAAEAQAKKLEQTRAQAETAFHAAKEEYAALEYDLKAIEAERIRAEQDEAGLRASVSQHRVLLDSLQHQYDGLVLERDNLAAAKQQYADAIAQCDAKQAGAQQALDDAEREVARCRAALDLQGAQAAENAARMTAVQTELAQNRSEAASEARTLADLEQLKAELDAGVSGAAETIAGFEAEITRLTDELAQTEDAAKDTAAAETRLHENLDAQMQQRERVEGERARVDREAQGKNEEILNLERESARLENRAGQLKNEETQILDKMWENYELTPTPAAEVARPLEDVPAAKEQAQSIRAKMRALGNVNLDAVEEYQQALERYTFMGEQKDDLEKAQHELYKVIEQLTVNMKEIFASEFAKLNAYFGETFREIFGGGHAELQLADTSDILSCGIDIKVSPPGKAVKTLTLLSGGEKAFVAIALYFAILKLRPTPFCVLDEIEAALDDVNVARFAQYIRRLTDSTQFIVITHRRGTMEEADMLYGVTMQEQGVSKMLMLNLAEAEKQLGNAIR
ncbi:chromosome segregation protein SMC [Agathobaculum sp. Marseille-P7918]|uniref:chromosome segregation protein SMC n=1 Tax=Agathobaculum sp. Marseille-P7918 TaxID=2479843 RepID=UPI000F630911|nr:chromosome segregation protein SMC [Agathobaculum sp. Marseille-P7918]